MMNLRQWVRFLRRRNPKLSAREFDTRVRLKLEALEDRLVPSWAVRSISEAIRFIRSPARVCG